MELMAYFHRIYGIVPWNPLNFHGINGKNLWHFMNFHNFLLLVYLPSTAMETLKKPSEYSVDFNRGFQGFSMANLEKGSLGRCLITWPIGLVFKQHPRDPANVNALKKHV